jgi:hypothetical protein
MTKKEELDAAILKVHDQLDDQPDDDLFVDFVTVANNIQAIENGFVDVLKAAANVRDLQRRYFVARKQNMTASAAELLTKSKEAEKNFDKLIASWAVQMGKTDQSQLGLFS